MADINGFVGVWGAPDAARALQSLGSPRPAWHDGRVAFANTLVWEDKPTGLVIAGEWVPDGDLESLRRAAEVPPDAPPLAIVAALFRRQGMIAAQQLTGMFALAVYEPMPGQLTLLRDASGARTLYHTDTGGTVYFASRLRSLRRAPGVGGVHLPALRDYLTCAYVPGAQTLRVGVHELRPGSALTLPGGASQTYWTPREVVHETDDVPLEVHAARLRPLVEAAVERALPPSNSLISAFLSGGVDSSLVTAMAAKMRGGQNVHTFAIHFGANYANELHFSQMVADHCHTRHQAIELPPRLILRHLHETIAQLDDPIGDPLTVPNWLLGAAAKAVVGEGGTVLNGEGGDPVFGGPKNGPMLLHELYTGDDETESIAAYFRSYQKCYDDLPRLLTADVQAALRAAPPQSELLRPYLGPDAPMRAYLNRLMHINVALKGADHILTKVNNLTTARGLVGRSPLFDPRIVEAGFALPPSCKLSGSQEKAVLKAAVADLLPAPILTRPKSGMLVPVQRWFVHDMKRYAQGMLLSRRSRIRPYINQNVVREWFRRGSSPYPREGVKLWLLLTLEIWLRVNE